MRAELAAPVDRDAPGPELAPELLDRRVGRARRMLAGLDRVVLGRQAEGVVAHRVQHPHAVAAPEVGEHVAHRVVLEVAHVRLARRIGQHLEHVALGRGGVEAGLAGVRHLPGSLALPDVLPLALDRVRRRSGLRSCHGPIVPPELADRSYIPPMRCGERENSGRRRPFSHEARRGTGAMDHDERHAVEAAAPAAQATRRATPRARPGRPSTRAGSAPEAERLLWRAGFGPRPGEAENSRRRASTTRSHSLTRPREGTAIGPAPHDERRPRARAVDAWGHDHLWWLDRMVRTNRPADRAHDARLARLVCDVQRRRRVPAADDPAEPALPQERARVVREAAARRDPRSRDADLALGVENTKDAPNENYGRELMELFTLGAGRGYSENDVREQARALTGFRNEWDDASARTTSASTPPTTTRASNASWASAGASTGGTPAALHQHRAIHRSSSEAVVLLHPDGARPHDASALERITWRATTRSGRWSRRSCATPTSTRARAW